MVSFYCVNSHFKGRVFKVGQKKYFQGIYKKNRKKILYLIILITLQINAVSIKCLLVYEFLWSANMISKKKLGFLIWKLQKCVTLVEMRKKNRKNFLTLKTVLKPSWNHFEMKKKIDFLRFLLFFDWKFFVP